MPELVIGIDPGLSGAIAFLDGQRLVAIFDVPTLQIDRNSRRKREIDLQALRSFIGWSKDPPEHAFIELVGPMPKQSTTGAFVFGKTFGIFLGLLAASGIPFTTVSSLRWRNALQVPKGKDGSRARAIQLWPSEARSFARVKDDGRADACLIAEWGRRNLTRVAA